ncbi:MAG: tripartite tricarboxylate transporter TctB family protein [Pseudomonadota bacterium]
MSERALVALVLLLGGAGLAYTAYGSGGFADLGGAFSPMFFPRIVLAVWLALALVNLVLDLRQGAEGPTLPPLRAGLIAVAVLAYVQLLIPLGFFLASVAFAVVALPLLGVRNIPMIAALALAVPGALVALFNHTLAMPLPTSPFVWWL